MSSHATPLSALQCLLADSFERDTTAQDHLGLLCIACAFACTSYCISLFLGRALDLCYPSKIVELVYMYFEIQQRSRMRVKGQRNRCTLTSHFENCIPYTNNQRESFGETEGHLIKEDKAKSNGTLKKASVAVSYRLPAATGYYRCNHNRVARELVCA